MAEKFVPTVPLGEINVQRITKDNDVVTTSQHPSMKVIIEPDSNIWNIYFTAYHFSDWAAPIWKRGYFYNDKRKNNKILSNR